jgi:aldehyde oxidoreductase
MLAAKMKIDPFEFRMKNSLRPGESMSTGHVAEEWAFLGCLERMKPLYEKAREEAKKQKDGVIRRGIGLGGTSFGVGAANDTTHVAVELDPDGGLTVYGSVADPGEGNDSMLTQIAAHSMGLPLDKIRLVTRDSELTPDSGISAGSKQTYTSGFVLMQAIEKLKAAMKETGAKTHADLVKAGKPTRYLATRTLPHKGLDPETGQGVAWDSRIHGAQMAEVEVNTKTGEVKLLKLTTIVDAGTVINPLVVRGQIEGGADQGAGYALREQYILGKTKDWVTFKFPTMETSFPMETIMLESKRARGPLGATGVGEFTMVAVHPAIANAVYDAIGVRVHDLPITPDRVLAALAKK